MSSLGPRKPLRHPRALASFGDHVRLRRVSLGMTQQDCANNSSFSQAWLAQLETGRVNPTLSTLLDLAAVLDISLSGLISNLGVDSDD